MRPRQILSRLRDRKGQALVEFLFILPLVLLLILNLVNFGAFFYAWITVADAARAGANYAIQGGAGVASLSAPTASQVTTIVNAAMSSLPNASSATVTVCPGTTGCTITNTEPESAYFNIVEVNVSYAYTPLIRGFSFPNLGIYLTIPPTTISQRAAMRSMP